MAGAWLRSLRRSQSEREAGEKENDRGGNAALGHFLGSLGRKASRCREVAEPTADRGAVEDCGRELGVCV